MTRLPSYLLRKGPPAAAASVPAGPSRRSAPAGPSAPSPPTPSPPMTPAEQPREQRSRGRGGGATGGVALDGSGVPMVSSDRTPEEAETLRGAHHAEGSRDPPPDASTPPNAPRKSAAADLFWGFSSSSDSDDDTAAVAQGPGGTSSSSRRVRKRVRGRGGGGAAGSEGAIDAEASEREAADGRGVAPWCSSGLQPLASWKEAQGLLP